PTNGDSTQQASNCDEILAQILCNEFKNEVLECAELMPSDEQELFFECAQDLEISSTPIWSEILDSICTQNNAAQVSFGMVSCWDEKRNETLEEIQNDKIYPYEHFMCKRRISLLIMEQASCPCKIEKGILCTPIPQFNKLPKLG
ncbi:uncharacterized protein NPIL_704181, partial [Nephila pilipes]